ncbi:MAG: AsmA family protein [Limisphaerales bacterium]
MKKLIVFLGVVAALVVVAFFVVTSSGFLKSVVLPRVGAALNAKVEADRIAVSPFSSVEVQNLRITPNGAETLATVDLARVRYKLFSILGGRMEIPEVLVRNPVISLVSKADGSSNLDPILNRLNQGGSAPAPAPSSPPASGKPLQVDLGSLVVENAAFTYRSTAADGSRTDADVTALGLNVTGIRNGGKGQITVGSGFGFSQVPAGAVAGAGTHRVQGSLKGSFDLEMTPDLLPGGLSGKLETGLTDTAGSFQEFKGFAAVLSADLAMTELRRLALEFSKQGTALGSIAAKGPLDLAKKEATIDLSVNAIDRNVLNLVGAGMGLDFTTTRFDSTNVVTLGSGGNALGIVGGVTGSRVAVKSGEMVMPALDLSESYDLAIDLAAQTAHLKRFALNGTQGGREILRGSLSQPLQISWSATAGALPDARVELAVTDLRLQDWSALAGAPLQGTVQAKANLGVQGGGKDLGFSLTAGLSGMSGEFGSNAIRNLGMQAAAEGSMAAFADAAKRRLVMTTRVTDLTGEAAVVKFDRYGIEAKTDLSLPEGSVTMNEIEVAMRQGATDGGRVRLTGQWNLASGGGDLQLTAQGVNEAGLRPFLQAALGDKQLRSVQLSADLATKIDPKGESSVKASAMVTNLVVRDPAGTVPETPLAVGLGLDASGTQQKLTLRNAGLRLTPTARAKNEVTLSGDLDFSKSDALKGAFRLNSESLDVTPYYDLFAEGQPSTTSPAPSSPTPAPAPGGPSKEPDAIQLPVELLTFDARVGKFFLREVAAENFVAGLKVEKTRVELQPFQLSLNGAPIQSGMKFNLGVPGFEYDINLSADGLPVKPLANSFVPMLKDRIEGSIVAGAKIQGAGVTGVNLRKSLQGGLNFAVTNANLKLTGASGQKPGILSVLTGLLASALNIRELKDRPIMEIQAGAKLGDGKIELVDTLARSASLEITTKGAIPIADDLMASPLGFPVNVSLSRELAEKARLVNADTPTNAVYVPVPTIASLKGTLGEPKPDVDKVQAGLLAARGIAGIVGGETGNKIGGVANLLSGVTKGETNAVGNLIQGLGGLFGGKKPATNAAPASTPAPTNSAPPKP